PHVGIEDIAFSKDGLLMLTIGIGCDRASLGFGGGQSSSGVTADLVGVMGTFDIGVDVFGLLSGKVRINVPGKFSFRVASLEVMVPDVVQIQAEGISIAYDPAGPVTQELVRIESAAVAFPKFNVRGSISQYDPTPGSVPGDEIPGLVVRKNGFQLGTAELRYGGNSGNLEAVPGTPTAADKKIRLGSILELNDIRIGVQNFGITFGAAVSFSGNIYVATGGAALFPGKPVSATVSDRLTADDRNPDGTQNDEAMRMELQFENSRVKAFVFDVDTLEVKISTFVTLTARDLKLNTGAGPAEELVSFQSIGAKVKIGSLELGGEGRNFAFLGDGTFITKPGFGVFLSIGSATGDSFKWPSWLPVKINAIGIEWPDFNADASDFLLTLSASVTELPAVPGMKFSGSIEGVKISPRLLLEGKFPIVDIAAIGVSVEGNLFGGKIKGALIGGILKVDSGANIIGDFDRTTPVADRIFYIGIQGAFSMPGLGGLEIRLALSELGPLGVFLRCSVPGGIMLEPNTGLSMNDFAAGVDFFTTLPSIEDPLDLRGPAFGLPSDMTPEQWLASVKLQVVNQYKAVKANPGLGGFLAAFTAPMTITGSAKIFTIYASEQVFNGQVVLKISTDGKILIVGKLNFAADNLSISGRLYADLSRVATGDVVVLFLADIPDQVRLLTIDGKIKMGFRNAAGEEVTFQVANAPAAGTTALKPTAALVDPAGAALDVNRINNAGRKFNGNAYLDVAYMAPSGAKLDYASILDADPEFTLRIAGVTKQVSGVPVPVTTATGADGMVTTMALVPNTGETLIDAIRRTGTNRFRYEITESNFAFPMGEVQLAFAAGAFKNEDVTLESGTVVTGAASDELVLGFTVEGATAVLLDPGARGGIDLNVLNSRGYLDVNFLPAAGATLDDNSVLDSSAEFTLAGTAAVGVVVNGKPEKVGASTFRYSFTGQFTVGEVSVAFTESRWTDSAGNTNRTFAQTFRVEGATADLTNPGPSGALGVDTLNARGWLEVAFRPTSGRMLDYSTIDGDELVLRDAQGNPVPLGATPQRVAGTDRYRYSIAAPLTLGEYKVEYAAGSFADDSGVVNLAETETFRLEVPTSALAGPLSGDVVDREAINSRHYLDVSFKPTGSASLNVGSILDSGQEFTLSGADGQNVLVNGAPTIITAADGSVTFRYSFAGQLNTGVLTVSFIAGSWTDSAGNAGTASTGAVKIITQAAVFFIEISGGVELRAADFLDEPLFTVRAQVTMEIDAARKVFTLEFNGQLTLIKLGTVGATSGRFVLDMSGTVSSLPQFWGVMTLETNFKEFEQYGIFISGKGMVQVNITAYEKT
ncbi:MAG: hypothetical protein NTU94_04440, partial [Planctomycetota bacterium]|nr:hypothetical protein [Planctomycetota bacterium]